MGVMEFLTAHMKVRLGETEIDSKIRLGQKLNDQGQVKMKLRDEGQERLEIK